MITTLNLFSGIGGITLGLERTGAFETTSFCEIDPWCRRQLRKHWPDTPIFEDVANLKGSDIGTIDLIAGGFPCQDISIAGNRAGLSGTRSGLWSEFARLIGELRPHFALIENVRNLLAGPAEQPGQWFGRILSDLAAMRYDAEWFSLPAAAFGAPHWRWRVFILTYPNSQRRQKCVLPPLPAQERQRQFRFAPVENGLFWPQAQPPLLTRNHGLPGDLDTIKAAGNSVYVPLIEQLGHAIAATFMEDN